MTVNLFIILITLGAAVASLLTEAIKTAFSNAGKNCSPNMIALINSVIVGGLGTILSYILIGIPFTVNNVICIPLMMLCIWVGSMVGYDKIIQLIQQIGGAKN